MVKKAKVDYDYENDVLYVYTGEKVKDSLDIENFVVDFSSDNKIVAVEVLDAARVLSKMLQIDINKDVLSGVKEAGINIYQGREIVYVVLMFPIIVNKQRVDVKVPIPTAVAAVSV